MLRTNNLQFKEANLPLDFRGNDVKKIYQLIKNSTSFTVVGLPALGISIFLRYLASLKFAHFIHVDIYVPTYLNSIEVFKLINFTLGGSFRSEKGGENIVEMCKTKIKKLTLQHDRVVIIFNRFDQIKHEFSADFFNKLRSLRDVDHEKVVLIFSANRPLIELAPQAVTGGNINLYYKSFYLKPYLEKDLIKLIQLNYPEIDISTSIFNKYLKLSGGHYQLLQLLIKSEREENYLLDPFIKLQLEELYNNLNYRDKKQLLKLARGKQITQVSDFLLNSGIIEKNEKGYQIFTPLLVKYIVSQSAMKLPIKERRLFNLLKENLGNIVSKDQIFAQIWEDPLEASDWALNALIYRLRRNPAFLISGYSIENYKKEGYMLLKN